MLEGVKPVRTIGGVLLFRAVNSGDRSSGSYCRWIDYVRVALDCTLILRVMTHDPDREQILYLFYLLVYLTSHTQTHNYLLQYVPRGLELWAVCQLKLKLSNTSAENVNRDPSVVLHLVQLKPSTCNMMKMKYENKVRALTGSYGSSPTPQMVNRY